MSRTRTFVSTERTTSLDMPPDACFHVGHRARLWERREHRPVNLLRRVPTHTPDQDIVTGIIPRQHLAGAKAEFLPDLAGNRYLAVCGELRMRDRHVRYSHGNERWPSRLILPPYRPGEPVRLPT